MSLYALEGRVENRVFDWQVEGLFPLSRRRGALGNEPALTEPAIAGHSRERASFKN